MCPYCLNMCPCQPGVSSTDRLARQDRNCSWAWGSQHLWPHLSPCWVFGFPDKQEGLPVLWNSTSLTSRQRCTEQPLRWSTVGLLQHQALPWVLEFYPLVKKTESYPHRNDHSGKEPMRTKPNQPTLSQRGPCVCFLPSLHV